MSSRTGSRATRRAPARTVTRSHRQPRRERTLRTVVGAPTYAVWLAMLRSLAPDARTHRLSVVVASMLRHAAEVALARFGEDPPEGSAAASLIQTAEEPDLEEESDGIRDLVEALFRDAKVAGKRVSARGHEYSIVDSAIEEFTSWYAMPWD